MNDVIRLLPDSVANQIAAGEVIQRPASVIKELVENAVDAGASNIRIFIKDAGRTLIQVVDDGCGMSQTDARMAFERHATSKINRADDLFTLKTMGFRGEALPSICAISQIEIRSKRESDSIGTRLVINGSNVEGQEAVVCDTGTSISVRNLFFNVPARRKFLKSDNVELANIMREFERLALVNNNIRMSIDTGLRQLDLRPGTFKQRIHDIWKNNLNMQLLPVEVDTSLIKIRGYISRPEFARRRNALQYLIVNGRNMKHPYFHKAIVSCFEGLIATDTQPCYFLRFDVDPSTIDVNIHPTKSEIKFEYESEIWPLLVAGVKASLGKNSAVPSIDFTAETVTVSPLHEGERPVRPSLGVERGYNPFKSGRERERDNLRNWDTLYSDFMKRREVELPSAPEFEKSDIIPGTVSTRDVPMCLQYAEKYIVTPTRDGLMIIDQHRAHVKILYEQYYSAVTLSEGVAQGVMFPDTVELDEAQQASLIEVESEMSRMGFTLEYDEENRWRIVTVPVMLHGADPKDIVLRILDSVSETSINYGGDEEPVDAILRKMALVMARNAAIRRGKRLTQEEMEGIIAELFALPDPAYTPNGNSIYVILNESSIARLL